MATTVDKEYRTRRTAVLGSWAWSPAQLVAGAIGVLFIVMGGIAMARAGFDGGATAEVVEVAGFGHTFLLGAIEVVFGLLVLAAAAGPFESRGWLATMGVAALAFGLIVLFEPAAMEGSLGTTVENGWLYTIVGGIAVLAAWLSPTIVSDRRAEIEHDEDRVMVA